MSETAESKPETTMSIERTSAESSISDVGSGGVAEGKAAGGRVGDGGASADPASGIRPRIRFGAIAWGLVVCGIAATVLTVIGTPDARSAFAAWLGSLTPGGYVLIGVLVVGGLVLLWGLLGVIRRLQRRGRV